MLTENQQSSNGADANTKPRTMEEDLAAIHAAFERGKVKRARAAESAGDGYGSVMELLHM